MNLEHVEERCLGYLAQTSSPLTPVRVLLEVCQRDESGRDLTLPMLLDFLRAHAEIQVLEGPTDEERVNADAFAEAGLEMGPRAILKTRIPDPKDMLAMLGAQIATMKEVLGKALAGLEGNEGDPRLDLLREALERAKTLEERLRQSTKPGPE